MKASPSRGPRRQQNATIYQRFASSYRKSATATRCRADFECRGCKPAWRLRRRLVAVATGDFRWDRLLRLLAVGADLVAVGVAGVGDVVGAVAGARPRLAVVLAAAGERRGMEAVDRLPGLGHQRDHRAVAEGRLLLVVGFGHVELRLLGRALRPVADVAVAAAGLHQTERRERGVVEPGGALEIAGSNHHVGEHV